MDTFVLGLLIVIMGLAMCDIDNDIDPWFF